MFLRSFTFLWTIFYWVTDLLITGHRLAKIVFKTSRMIFLFIFNRAVIHYELKFFIGNVCGSWSGLIFINHVLTQNLLRGKILTMDETRIQQEKWGIEIYCSVQSLLSKGRASVFQIYSCIFFIDCLKKCLTRLLSQTERNKFCRDL